MQSLLQEVMLAHIYASTHIPSRTAKGTELQRVQFKCNGWLGKGSVEVSSAVNSQQRVWGKTLPGQEHGSTLVHLRGAM